jgi:hypothetical protein
MDKAAQRQRRHFLHVIVAKVAASASTTMLACAL